MNYIDAIVEYCNIHNIEIESVGKLVSKPLKEKLRYDANQLNYLKASSLTSKPNSPSDTMHLSGFDVYRTFLAMKQHFINPKFDFFKYDGKINAKESTYTARNDFYFFESLARKLTAVEVKEYLLSNFIYADQPSKVWIGDIKRNGASNWNAWQKANKALTYNFQQDLNNIAEVMEARDYAFNDLFACKGGHPPLLRLYIRKQILT